MRVLFWGTPDFAVPTLRALVREGHELAGVVTQPDRPAGRGRVLRPSSVHVVARALEIPVLQPRRPRGEEFVGRLRELAPDLSVVAAYGHILTDEVLELPLHGSLNIHASLLPRLRGAAPVNWAIIRGCPVSGVTVMRMVRALDAGPIVHQVQVEIGSDMTAGKLYDVSAELGAEAMVKVLVDLEAGCLSEREQEHDRASYAPKLDREAARVEWGRPAVELARWIRGCDPWPGAWSELNGAAVQLFAPRVEEVPASRQAVPGIVLEADSQEGVLVAAGEGSVRIGAVKPAGRRRMSSAAWVRGRGPSPGSRFV